MDLPFTTKPGRRERHLRRRHENPLFAWPPIEVESEDLIAALKADHEEMEAFRDSFQALVQQAVDLPPNAGSDTLLGLKEELEKLYEQASGLPEDHRQEKEALRKLVDLIMKAVRRAAGEDPLAHQELEEAEEARVIHFRLLEQPLVVDMLHPESPIETDELVPSLLSASAEEVEAALEVFGADQLGLIAAQGRGLLDGLDREVDTEIPQQRLNLIDKALSAKTNPSPAVDSTTKCQ
jgi:hypothetical protein